MIENKCCFFIRCGLLLFFLTSSLTSQSLKSKISLVSNTSFPPIQVWFGPSASDDGEGLYFNLMRFLDTASNSLYFAIHDLNLFSVAQKLVELKQRGVYIEGIFEHDYLEDEDNRFIFDLLKKHGIRLQTHTPSGLMHNKYLIIDKKRIWSGSANFTERGYFFHYNDTLWIESSEVARHYLKDYKRITDVRGYRKSGTLGKQFFFSLGSNEDHQVEIYFSPIDAPTQYLLDNIEKTKEKLDFLIFAYSSADICTSMMNAHLRGVSIQGIFDNSFSSPRVTKRWSTVPYNVLKSGGVKIAYDDERAKVHHKLMVLDEKSVITGSFNFSQNAEKRNNENVLVIHSPSVAKSYGNHFEKLWRKFSHSSLFDRYSTVKKTKEKTKGKKKVIPSWDAYKKNYYRQEAKSYNRLMNKGEFTGIMRQAVNASTLTVEVPSMNEFITVKLAGIRSPITHSSKITPLQKLANDKGLQELSLLGNQKPVRVLVLWKNEGWLSCEGIVYYSAYRGKRNVWRKTSLNEMLLRKGWGYFDLENQLQSKFKQSPLYTFAAKCKKASLQAQKLKLGIWSDRFK